MVNQANDNATCHLAKLDGKRMTVPIVRGKELRLNVFKNHLDESPELDDFKEDGGDIEQESDSNG